MKRRLDPDDIAVARVSRRSALASIGATVALAVSGGGCGTGCSDSDDESTIETDPPGAGVRCRPQWPCTDGDVTTRCTDADCCDEPGSGRECRGDPENRGRTCSGV